MKVECAHAHVLVIIWYTYYFGGRSEHNIVEFTKFRLDIPDEQRSSLLGSLLPSSPWIPSPWSPPGLHPRSQKFPYSSWTNPIHHQQQGLLRQQSSADLQTDLLRQYFALQGLHQYFSISVLQYFRISSVFCLARSSSRRDAGPTSSTSIQKSSTLEVGLNFKIIAKKHKAVSNLQQQLWFWRYFQTLHQRFKAQNSPFPCQYFF